MDQATVSPAPRSNREEGERLAIAAEAAGLALKLFGGVAVALACPSAGRPPLRREIADIDFATLSRSTRAVTAFLEAEGYEPDRLFNALHGASRLQFSDATRAIDVIVDRFVMCHTIDLRDALEGPGLLVPLTELLLMKLQIVELNDKDLRDILAILVDHGLVGEDALDVGRLQRLAGGDWGLEHTIRGTLARVAAAIPTSGLAPEAAGIAKERVDRLVAALDAGQKSIGWRLRARVGERVRWYELPEEPRHQPG